jgi:hypothetical protein
MDVIYVVTEEYGEYSDWDKKNIAFFITKKEATEFAKFQQRISDINEDELIFSVEDVSIGSMPADKDVLITKALADKKLRNEKMKRRRNQIEKEKEEEFMRKSKEATDAVNKMLDEWETKPDENKLHRMRDSLPTFIKQINDIKTINRAREWILHNGKMETT